MRNNLVLTIILVFSSSCGPTPGEMNDEWFNYYNNTDSAIMNKLSEIMKRKGEYPSKEFCTNEDQLNQESRTGYKADGTPGTNFTPQYWSKIRFEPYGNGTLHKGVKQTPWHSIGYSYEFKIKWYFQLFNSNLENNYVLYKLDDGGKVEKIPISLILENFTYNERDEFWICVDSVKNEFMSKNSYVINKNGNFEQNKKAWKDGKRHGEWWVYDSYWYNDHIEKGKGHYNGGKKEGLWHYYYQKKDSVGVTYNDSAKITYKEGKAIYSIEKLRKSGASIILIHLLRKEVKEKSELSSKYLYMIGDIYMNDIRNFLVAIEIYREVINDFSGSAQEPHALFMIGYIYANVINDYTSAEIEYKEFLNRFPNHKLTPTVNFEMDFMRKDIQDIPEEELKKYIQ